MFYPEAAEQACTAALLLEIDLVGLVRNRRGPAGECRSLEQYVNDRPYAASSFLSVALGDVFSSAMAGKAKDRAELVDAPIPLRTVISSVPCHAGVLSNGKGFYHPVVYVLECHQIGLKILPPSVNEPGPAFIPQGQSIRVPLTNISGLTTRTLNDGGFFPSGRSDRRGIGS